MLVLYRDDVKSSVKEKPSEPNRQISSKDFQYV